jgi:predicted metal-dependent peptidase
VRAPGHVFFAIDTSGSMTKELLSAAFSEIRSFRETHPAKLTLLQADDKIRATEEYEPFDGTDLPEIFTVRGRGGTDFRPVFKYAAEQAASLVCLLIYVTDGYGVFPEEEPPFPVLWLVTKQGVAREKVPFGEVLRLS